MYLEQNHRIIFLCIDYTIWPGWNHRGVYILSRQTELKVSECIQSRIIGLYSCVLITLAYSLPKQLPISQTTKMTSWTKKFGMKKSMLLKVKYTVSIILLFWIKTTLLLFFYFPSAWESYKPFGNQNQNFISASKIHSFFNRL